MRVPIERGACFRASAIRLSLLPRPTMPVPFAGTTRALRADRGRGALALQFAVAATAGEAAARLREAESASRFADAQVDPNG